MNVISPSDIKRTATIFIVALMTVTLTIANAVADSLADALDNPGLVWSSYGDAPWIPQTSVSHDGVDAAESGTIIDNQNSLLTASIAGPGKLNFWWKVSSEEGFDYLDFLVDGYISNSITGTNNLWAPVSVSIPSGLHQLYWKYSKDVSTSSGQDKAWVDQVVFAAPSTLLSNSVARGANSQFLFQFTGSLGASYTIQSSSNLVNWQFLTNYTATNFPISVIDTEILNYPRRFFRVVSP